MISLVAQQLPPTKKQYQQEQLQATRNNKPWCQQCTAGNPKTRKFQGWGFLCVKVDNSPRSTTLSTRHVEVEVDTTCRVEVVTTPKPNYFEVEMMLAWGRNHYYLRLETPQNSSVYLIFDLLCSTECDSTTRKEVQISTSAIPLYVQGSSYDDELQML